MRLTNAQFVKRKHLLHIFLSYKMYFLTSLLENNPKIKPSHIYNRSGLNKIFVSPAFTPNLSLEKSINGLTSPSVLPAERSPLLNKIFQDKVSINGPIFFCLHGTWKFKILLWKSFSPNSFWFKLVLLCSD